MATPPNILNIHNFTKYSKMIQLIKEEKYQELSQFIYPWDIARDNPTKIIVKGNNLYKSEGNYFEFLRWLAFKIVQEKDLTYLNKDTISLLMFLEEHAITGIFFVGQISEQNPGKLFLLLKKYNEFKHTSDIITLSNTQLVQYIQNIPSINRSISKRRKLKTGGKRRKTRKSTLKKWSQTKRKKKSKKKRRRRN